MKNWIGISIDEEGTIAVFPDYWTLDVMLELGRTGPFDVIVDDPRVFYVVNNGDPTYVSEFLIIDRALLLNLPKP